MGNVMIAPALLLLLLVGITLLAQRAAYHNGFWDGVLWEREREGRIWPVDADPEQYTPGGESSYPSKPGPSWHGWASLAAGARERKQE